VVDLTSPGVRALATLTLKKGVGEKKLILLPRVSFHIDKANN
jgi:hypothetical protein